MHRSFFRFFTIFSKNNFYFLHKKFSSPINIILFFAKFYTLLAFDWTNFVKLGPELDLFRLNPKVFDLVDFGEVWEG